MARDICNWSESVGQLIKGSSMFVITSLHNATDQALHLSITPIGAIQSQEISLPPKKGIKIDLPFGRVEHASHPIGYRFANISADRPFHLLEVAYDKTEDPLLDVFREHTEFITKRFIHQWTIKVDGKILQTYSAYEGVPIEYRLVIEPQRVFAEIAAS